MGLQRGLNKPVSESSLHDAMQQALLSTTLAPTHRQNRVRKREQQHDFSRIRHARILLVDDVELNRMVAQAFLGQAGMTADIAVNGQEAVQKVSQGNYDLVLMDIQMPVLDGLTATRQIRSDPRFAGLPILAMTAHAMSTDRDRSLQAGMNDHLVKPINHDTFFNALLRWIKPHDNPDEAAAPPPGADDTAMAQTLPRLDGIDTERGLFNHLGRPALYRQILDGFKREFGASPDDISHALAQGDFALAQRLAHSIKSAAATIGANGLSESARLLEEHFAQSQRAEAEFAPFVAALRRVLQSLASLPDNQPLFCVGEDPLKTLASLDVQLALLDRLENLLRHDDAAAARLLGDISASLADPRHQDDLQLLRDLVDDIEYPRALEVLARLRSSLVGKQP